MATVGEAEAGSGANKPAAQEYTSGKDMDATTFNEAMAVAQARDGDTLAFEALVRAYQRRAYSVAYGFVGNRDDALELAQESFARAYRAIHRFDARMPFYPWLYQIVRNTCLSHLKKKRRHGEVSLDSLVESGYEPTDGGTGPLHSAEVQELRRSIAEALGRLSPEHREIIVLRHLQELSYTEIAECLGIPKGTVMSRLHAARQNLRAVLQTPPVTRGRPDER